jgi:hypothetical protein
VRRLVRPARSPLNHARASRLSLSYGLSELVQLRRPARYPFR